LVRRGDNSLRKRRKEGLQKGRGQKRLERLSESWGGAARGGSKKKRKVPGENGKNPLGLKFFGGGERQGGVKMNQNRGPSKEKARVPLTG